MVNNYAWYTSKQQLQSFSNRNLSQVSVLAKFNQMLWWEFSCCLCCDCVRDSSTTDYLISIRLIWQNHNHFRKLFWKTSILESFYRTLVTVCEMNRENSTTTIKVHLLSFCWKSEFNSFYGWTSIRHVYSRII